MTVNSVKNLDHQQMLRVFLILYAVILPIKSYKYEVNYLSISDVSDSDYCNSEGTDTLLKTKKS